MNRRCSESASVDRAGSRVGRECEGNALVGVVIEDGVDVGAFVMVLLIYILECVEKIPRPAIRAADRHLSGTIRPHPPSRMQPISSFHFSSTSPGCSQNFHFRKPSR